MTRKPKPPAPSVLIRSKIPAALFSQLELAASTDGVTVPTFLRSLVACYLADPCWKLRHLSVAVGLAAASDSTRRAVASKGGQAKKAKENKRG